MNDLTEDRNFIFCDIDLKLTYPLSVQLIYVYMFFAELSGEAMIFHNIEFINFCRQAIYPEI